MLPTTAAPYAVRLLSGMPAHGVGVRGDLPLPFGVLLAAALLVLAISFGAVAFLWREPRLDRTDGWLLPDRSARLLDSGILRGALRTLVLILVVWVGIALVLGADTARNPTANVIYVWFWVGLAFASMLFGPVWRVLDPLRPLHRGVLRLAGIRSDTTAAPYRLGFWPAALGLASFAWVELVADDHTGLGFLRIAVGAYVATTMIGALACGPVWFDRADPFEVWSRQLGRLSALGRRDDGRWVLRTPLHGVNELGAAPGLVATVSVMLGSTAYDAFSANLSWADFVHDSGLPPALLETGAFLAFCLLVAGSLGVAALASVTLSRNPIASTPRFASQMAAALIPIAAGYVVAHYWSLFIYQGQVTVALLSNPFGQGPDLLGLGGFTPNAALIQPTLVASLQAIAIIVGHLLGVLAAHERAITLLDRRSAVVGQVPLMVLMISYTLGGLVLLFRP